MFNHYQPPMRNGVQGKGPFIIKVNGEGEIAVQPDSATINLGVISENKELLTAQQRNSEQSTKVITALVSQGINKADIQTFDYRIESDYDFVQGIQIFRGYKITNILQVKIEDLSTIGKIVDFSVQHGVNYVSNVQFKVKNKDIHYQHALTIAINNAMEKAKTIAQALNVTLAAVPSLLVEGGTTAEPFINQPGTFVKGISSTQIEPGQITIKARVLAEFHYRPSY
jgi:uncharacterized protein YggE